MQETKEGRCERTSRTPSELLYITKKYKRKQKDTINRQNFL